MVTDDIVTRLRERASDCQKELDDYWREYNFDHKMPMLENEAADEIEARDAEIKRLRNGIEKYATTISDPYCTPAMERDSLELLKKVWHGE